MAGQQRSFSVLPNNAASQRPQHRRGAGEATNRPSNFYFGPGSMNFNVHISRGSQVYFNGTPHQGAPVQGQGIADRPCHFQNSYDMDYSYDHMESPPPDGNTPVNEVLSPAVLAEAIASLQASPPPPRLSPQVSVRAPGYSPPTLLPSNTPNALGTGNGQQREQETPVSGRTTRSKGRQWAP